MIGIGGMHGNEPAGVLALQQGAASPALVPTSPSAARWWASPATVRPLPGAPGKSTRTSIVHGRRNVFWG